MKLPHFYRNATHSNESVFRNTAAALAQSMRNIMMLLHTLNWPSSPRTPRKESKPILMSGGIGLD